MTDTRREFEKMSGQQMQPALHTSRWEIWGWPGRLLFLTFWAMPAMMMWTMLSSFFYVVEPGYYAVCKRYFGGTDRVTHYDVAYEPGQQLTCLGTMYQIQAVGEEDIHQVITLRGGAQVDISWTFVWRLPGDISGRWRSSMEIMELMPGSLSTFIVGTAGLAMKETFSPLTLDMTNRVQGEDLQAFHRRLVERTEKALERYQIEIHSLVLSVPAHDTLE
jgi:hypothetical protein